MKLVTRWLVIPLILVSTWAMAQQLYRFKVDGQIQLKDHIPSEYNHLGYEVLNSQGRVISVVAPAPTASDLARIRAQEKEQAQREQTIQQRKEQDHLLLRLYSGPADVRLVEQRKQQEAAHYIQTQKNQIEDFTQKLEKITLELANYKNNQQTAPADLYEEQERMQAAIKNNQDNILKREQEERGLAATLQEQYLRMQILQIYAPGTLMDDVDLMRVQQRTDP